MDKMKKIATLIATTAAISFVSAPLVATVANAKTVKCYGVNSCKGKSKCKTAQNGCKGKNSCKGKGYLKTTAKKCTKLNGTTTETDTTTTTDATGATGNTGTTTTDTTNTGG